MKQPITMRCNEYQFNEIKEKLKGKVNLTMLSEFNSNERFYLINHLCEEQNTVTNVVNPIKREGVVFYEEWNEKIFLEACGIEVEKKFSITESQIKELVEKCPSSQCKEDYLKELFPEAFESEVKYEAGKWYIEKTDLSNGFRIIFVKEVTESVIKGYGLNGYGEWDEKLSYGFGDFIEATEQEVFEALKNEAVKRGFKEGSYIDRSEMPDILNNNIFLQAENFEYFPHKETLQIGNSMVYHKGKWCSIIPTITLSEAEQQLGKKIIV